MVIAPLLIAFCDVNHWSKLIFVQRLAGVNKTSTCQWLFTSHLWKLLSCVGCVKFRHSYEVHLNCNILQKRWRQRCVFTFCAHALNQALLESAVLASVAIPTSHLATLLKWALVYALIRYAALEEGPAALAGHDAVVRAVRLIATHEADIDIFLRHF